MSVDKEIELEKIRVTREIEFEKIKSDINATRGAFTAMMVFIFTTMFAAFFLEIQGHIARELFYFFSIMLILLFIFVILLKSRLIDREGIKEYNELLNKSYDEIDKLASKLNQKKTMDGPIEPQLKS